MAMSFSPALGKTTYATISNDVILGNTIPLRFTAKLSEQDFKQIEEGSLRVQMWSDIPVSGKTTSGEWNELDFISVDDASRTAGMDGPISLVGHSGHMDLPVERHLVNQISIQVPLHGEEIRFSFTYRLLFPSGEIKWLGQFGHNGTVVLKRGAIDHDLVLNDKWQKTEDGHLLELHGQMSSVNVAELVSMAKYRIWTFGKHRYHPLPLSQEANVLVLLPKDQTDALFAPPVYVLSASHGSSIRAMINGTFAAAGSGSVLVQTCQSNAFLPSLIRKALSHSSSENIQLELSDNMKYLLVSSIQKGYPVGMLIVPLEAAATSLQTLDVGVSTMAEALSISDTQQFSIFSPLNLDVHFVKAPFHGKSVSFIVDSTGGEFIISPVYDLLGPTKDGTSGKDPVLKIAILSPYTPIQEPHLSLPTPPPSPQTKRSQVTFASEYTIIPPPPYREPDSRLRQRFISTPEEATPEYNSEDKLPVEVAAATQDIFTIFRSFYASLTFYIGLLYYFFWAPISDKEESNWAEDDFYEPDDLKAKIDDGLGFSTTTLLSESTPTLISVDDSSMISDNVRPGHSNEDKNNTRENQIAEATSNDLFHSFDSNTSTQFLNGRYPDESMTLSSPLPSSSVFCAKLAINREQDLASIGFIVPSELSLEDNVNAALRYRLSKILEYNGQTPDDLTVRKGKGVRGQVNGEPDNEIDQWDFYLVEFPVSGTGSKAGAIKIINTGLRDQVPIIGGHQPDI